MPDLMLPPEPVMLDRDDLGLAPPRSISTDLAPTGNTGHYIGPTPWPASRPAFPYEPINVGPWVLDLGEVYSLLAVADHARCATIWRGIQAGHLADPKAADIYYTGGFCPHGYMLMGRGPGRRQGANGDNEGNRIRNSLCYLAGADDPLTPAAIVALHAWTPILGVGPVDVHNRWFNTSCAGPVFNSYAAAGFPTLDHITTEDFDMDEARLRQIIQEEVRPIVRQENERTSQMGKCFIADRGDGVPEGAWWWVVGKERKHIPSPTIYQLLYHYNLIGPIEVVNGYAIEALTVDDGPLLTDADLDRIAQQLGQASADELATKVADELAGRLAS